MDAPASKPDEPAPDPTPAPSSSSSVLQPAAYSLQSVPLQPNSSCSPAAIPVFSPRDSQPESPGGSSAERAWSRQRRLRVAAAGIVLLAMLVLALVLKPAPSGFGTHQQLGLPPCTFESLFGFRCPSCGMTTSWSHLLRGEFASSASANAGGMLLGLLALAAAPWLLLSAAAGRYVVCSPRFERWVVVAAIVVTVTLIHWVWRFAAP